MKASRSAGREPTGAALLRAARSLLRAPLASPWSARGGDRRLRSLLANSTEVVAICDRRGVLRFVSAAAGPVLGRSPEDLVGTALHALAHPADLRRHRREVAGVLSGALAAATVECRVRHRDGGWREMEVGLSDESGTAGVRGVVVTARDVSERREWARRLAHQAFHDPLTGLANRALFRDRVQHGLALRSRSRAPLAVLFADLDGFKAVNDSLGHSLGDRLLELAARRLGDCVRPGDTVARLGGDEFAVLLEDVDGVTMARQVAHRILEELRAPFQVDGHEIYVTASVGLAEAVAGDDVDELLRNADLAMYRAKGLGRDRCETFEPQMHAAVLSRLETEGELRRAVAAGELSLRYQPILDLRTAELVGVEALLRWEHPVRGTVSPAEFISIAEDSGLIVPIGRWVLQQAVRQVCRWEQETGRALELSVNLSARQLQAPKLAEHVAQVLRGAGLPPERLVLEITESMLVDDAERTIAKLHLLREIGVRLAIDDFGTGYSSLSYLRRLPVEVLKIDRSFVAGIGREDDVTAVTGAIVGLGHQLGLDVVAEGIEETWQLDGLRDMGCLHGQGFLFAHPLRAAEMTDLLRRRGRTLRLVPAAG